jgi:signal transduction histidine kinase
VIDVRRSAGRWTSQGWFAAVLIAMVALIGAGTVVGGQALSRTAAVSNRLSDRISPARTAVVQMGAALVGQASGVRGYLLTGDEQFLTPYAAGVTDEARSAAEIRRLLPDEPDALAELAAVERAAAGWRSVTADPLIAERRRTGAPTPSGERDRSAFGAVQERLAALDARLVAVRGAARADLAASRRVRDGVFTGLVAGLLLLILLTAVLLRLVVLRPLARLGLAVRRVAAGEFDHRVAPDGPSDLARLAGDVETMRRRLADSLRASEQQQTELRRSNADLEQFAYVASHDLQEPLRKVASFCQLLQRRYAGALDERAGQYIAFAVDGATRMQHLINDLLAFSRIGRVYDAVRPVDLGEVVDQVEETLGLVIAESGARIERPPLPVVPGDPTLLTMLWQNLIGNAIKFRRDGQPPRVVITAAEADGAWTFAVEDNGIGIDPEFSDKIFVIFQRLHAREAYAGTGIGLAICKKIVEHHGGAIRLDDACRDGARLVFTLPAASPGA